MVIISFYISFIPSTVTYHHVYLFTMFTNRSFQFFLLSKMAVAFETSDMILPKEQAEHNFCHKEVNGQCASKFKSSFNLTAMLALLMQKTWSTDLKGG